MSRIEDLAEQYAKHIATPWQRTVAGAQRVIMVVYDKELERTLRARKLAFENPTHQAGHGWIDTDLSAAFARWIADDEYRDAFFESPEDLQIKLDAEFADHLAGNLRAILSSPEADEQTVVAVFGLGSLFGFTRVSEVLKLVEGDIRGRLVLFFPGHLDGNNYRLLDARDGWNYLAVPISQHSEGGWV
jgi:hypothetical protein